MADHDPPAALDRIDRAIARIEAAATARHRADATLARRHEVLRRQMSHAITALDEIIADAGTD